jgi:hypothetical protein
MDGINRQQGDLIRLLFIFQNMRYVLKMKQRNAKFYRTEWVKTKEVKNNLSNSKCYLTKFSSMVRLKYRTLLSGM